MERDFDTFDPNEALVDEGRNLYYPAGWQKGDAVFVLNEPYDPGDGPLAGEPPCCECGSVEHSCEGCPVFYELEQRKGLDCE